MTNLVRFCPGRGLEEEARGRSLKMTTKVYRKILRRDVKISPITTSLRILKGAYQKQAYDGNQQSEDDAIYA